MKKWSHREYLTRLAWLDQEQDRPSRSDYYAMQIAQEVRRVLSKHPRAIKMSHFYLKREPNKAVSKPTKIDRNAEAQVAKTRWARKIGEFKSGK